MANIEIKAICHKCKKPLEIIDMPDSCPTLYKPGMAIVLSVKPCKCCDEYTIHALNQAYENGFNDARNYY